MKTFLSVAACTLLIAGSAHAHRVGLSIGNYTISGDTISAELSFKKKETDAAFPDGGWSKAIMAGILVTSGGKPCEPTLHDDRARGHGEGLRGSFKCAAPIEELEMTFPIIEQLATGHRHVVHMHAGDLAQRKIAQKGSTLKFSVDPDAMADEEISPFADFFIIGIEHIALGFDHLIFLLALFLVAGSVRAYVLMITAFTLAHSVTLALAVMEIYAPSGEFVEPVIALSIAWVGVENFIVKSVDKRWILTLCFGLIHGFGFAGALGDVGLPPDNIPMSLLAFNLGVEAGQLAILAIVLPALITARKEPWFNARVVPALNVAVILIGSYWFIERVFL